MDFKQRIDLILEQEQKKGALSKEAIKKMIEKIVDEFVKLKPTSQEQYNDYVMNAASLLVLIGQKAESLGIEITLIEACQEIIKAFAKHSLDKTIKSHFGDS